MATLNGKLEWHSLYIIAASTSPIAPIAPVRDLFPQHVTRISRQKATLQPRPTTKVSVFKKALEPWMTLKKKQKKTDIGDILLSAENLGNAINERRHRRYERH